MNFCEHFHSLPVLFSYSGAAPAPGMTSHWKQRTELERSVSIPPSATSPSGCCSARRCSQSIPYFLFLQHVKVKCREKKQPEASQWQRSRAFPHNPDNWPIYRHRVTEVLHLPHNCIKTPDSTESSHVVCSSAEHLLSNTLCHLTAVLEREGLKRFPKECWNVLRDWWLNVFVSRWERCYAAVWQAIHHREHTDRKLHATTQSVRMTDMLKHTPTVRTFRRTPTHTRALVSSKETDTHLCTCYHYDSRITQEDGRMHKHAKYWTNTSPSPKLSKSMANRRKKKKKRLRNDRGGEPQEWWNVDLQPE